MQLKLSGRIVAIDCPPFTGRPTADICGFFENTLDTVSVPINDEIAHEVKIGDRLRVYVEVVGEWSEDE